MNKIYFLLFLLLAVSFFGCSTRGKNVYYKNRVYLNSSERALDKKKYPHPTMRPYTVRGIKYYPTIVSVGDEYNGNASWYGPTFNGKLTSNGETYNMYAMTAAHKTLPMNTIVKVTNKRNGLSAVVRINDRGPFVSTRIIDLSKKAAGNIGMIGAGTAPVILEVLGFERKGKKRIPTTRELKKSPRNQSLSGYALQIASFSNIEGALKTQEKYSDIDGYRSIIKDVETDGGRMFKVILKGFESEQEARDYKSNSAFSTAFITREE